MGEAPDAPDAGSQTPQHSLGRRLVLTNILLVVSVVLIATAAGWGLLDLRRAVLVAVEEYEEAHLVEESLRHIDVAIAIASVNPGSPEILERAVLASEEVAEFLAEQDSLDSAGEQHQSDETGFARSARAQLETLAGVDAANRLGVLEAVQQSLVELVDVTDVKKVWFEASQHATGTLTAVALASAVLIASAVLVSIAGYRSVMRPVLTLRRGVRRLARGDFSDHIAVSGPTEIADLAREFNRMVDELNEIYRVLETRVAEKSRELVRAERLASVGFLAAGVAHEISTPLNIISGYAEMSRKWLNAAMTDGRASEARKALDLIAQEAFRCRKITEQLLSLARMGDGVHERVVLGAIVTEVAELTKGVSEAARRRLHVENNLLPSDAVWANASELKQVLMNLIANAIDATDDESGRIDIVAERRGGALRVEVRDNGVGIAPDAIEKVFEPFYTRKRTNKAGGTGIGLTISSTIIEAHAGRLSVTSAGQGKGSAFVITLPAMKEAAANAS